MPQPSQFADVILPLPLADYYTYRISEHFGDVEIGFRVIVPFGKKKFYTAIVANLHNNQPTEYQTKEISSVLDNSPIVTQMQLDLWKWIASYYQCSIGEVYKAALPAGLKPDSETIVTYNTEYECDGDISDKERKVLDAFLTQDKMNLSELEKASGVKNMLPVIKSLLEKDALLISEQLRKSYRAKTEPYIRLNKKYASEEELHVLFDSLSRAPKQLQLLMRFLEISHHLSNSVEVSKKTLLQANDASEAALAGLINKQVFEVYKKKVNRLKDFSGNENAISTLNPLQKQAFDEINQSFEDKDITLLHGVTSSGKTEVYIHLIAEMLKQNRQVLYLLPEIALTTQITERMSRIFGNKLCVYHSKFSDNERVEVWNRLLHDDCRIVLGVRSSVFLPFSRLGLIIADEEHENTYKQFDPAPRYHAKNTAMILAKMHRAKVLLGTATPSIESYFFAKTNKYGLVNMSARFEDMQMPMIEIVDTGLLYKRKQMVSHFSPFLLQQISETLKNGKQVILFQNRRGFAPMVECKLCAWVPKCKHCDVSLTYHKRYSQLTCHYCGYSENVPERCPACGNLSLVTHGFGTEKIEEEMAELFPDATIARLDLDTAKTRASYERIIADFESGQTQILIGTQMVSKGLDFDHVRVVGILNADTLINYPDFRAHERAFQLMAQVAGRAGRKNEQGLVILQTGNPTHSIIQKVKANDYQGMFDEQIGERRLFRYPPFTRLINIMLKHREQKTAESAAVRFAQQLRQVFGGRVLGPDKPIIERIQGLYIQKIVMKIETDASMERVKEILNLKRQELLQRNECKSIYIYYDVDPM